jgi:hypothetical protein
MIDDRDKPGVESTPAHPGSTGAGRLPYAPPRLVHLGSFRELTRGGGLTGHDTAPFANRPG